ncbi:uncharacterized protein MYCFIDRAFT_177000 [Pseudocercospora fijiensis CIRAD86]|uniref:RING-type domain-containing protein n=1 Tax=Pseudocercospora fijiensis (strain CIRAD86) TaxID=383855 RepID=M3A5W1_PSEFD|nr:uncharacterized protein MYCFIDRAFT_177000 [Pseudocercospora fijiensis CIRAD86]EME80011.1 hypothetical protein MYCFIDRAFT_177000 [Pseudocercospora fijiensis CIRAD86]
MAAQLHPSTSTSPMQTTSITLSYANSHQSNQDTYLRLQHTKAPIHCRRTLYYIATSTLTTPSHPRPQAPQILRAFLMQRTVPRIQTTSHFEPAMHQIADNILRLITQRSKSYISRPWHGSYFMKPQAGGRADFGHRTHPESTSKSQHWLATYSTPCCQHSSTMSLPTKEELLAQLLPDPKPECPVCRDEMEESTSTPCTHTFHLHCLASWLEKSNTCPLCRTKLYREALEPYYFRDSQEPLTINDISPHPHVWAANWAANRNIVLRNHRNNVLNHINKFRALQQSTFTGPERAFIGLDHDILDRLVAAYCWSRPNSVNNLGNADRCLTQWWLVFTAFLEVIDRLRGMLLLSKKVEFALNRALRLLRMTWRRMRTRKGLVRVYDDLMRAASQFEGRNRSSYVILLSMRSLSSHTSFQVCSLALCEEIRSSVNVFPDEGKSGACECFLSLSASAWRHVSPPPESMTRALPTMKPHRCEHD